MKTAGTAVAHFSVGSAWRAAWLLAGAGLAGCLGGGGTEPLRGCETPNYQFQVQLVDGEGRPVDSAAIERRLVTTGASLRPIVWVETWPSPPPGRYLLFTGSEPGLSSRGKETVTVRVIARKDGASAEAEYVLAEEHWSCDARVQAGPDTLVLR